MIAGAAGFSRFPSQKPDAGSDQVISKFGADFWNTSNLAVIPVKSCDYPGLSVPLGARMTLGLARFVHTGTNRGNQGRAFFMRCLEIGFRHKTENV